MTEGDDRRSLVSASSLRRQSCHDIGNRLLVHLIEMCGQGGVCGFQWLWPGAGLEVDHHLHSIPELIFS